MPHIRLIGLVLFITTIFLAMAAAATQTTHIRFKRLGTDLLQQPVIEALPQPGPPAQPDLILPPGAQIPPPETPALTAGDKELHFVAVPVIYPLLIAAAVGLGLWFVPAAHPRSTHQTKRRRRRRH